MIFNILEWPCSRVVKPSWATPLFGSPYRTIEKTLYREAVIQVIVSSSRPWRGID